MPSPKKQVKSKTASKKVVKASSKSSSKKTLLSTVRGYNPKTKALMIGGAAISTAALLHLLGQRIAMREYNIERAEENKKFRMPKLK
jgi:hypothetical protein